MYNIKEINFGKQLQYFRKTRNLSLTELDTKIGKSKATISKYESNQIIPDYITILELCNTLNITLSQLFPITEPKKQNFSKNPFSSNILYLYYYTENLLVKSLVEIYEEKNIFHAKLYNGIKNFQNYAIECAYQYNGFLETDSTIGYINLTNCNNQEKRLEKLQISFNIPWSNKFEITNFFLLGLTPNSVPIIKKGLISTIQLNNLNNFKEDLKLSSSEVNKILHDNGWILENKNYAHFFIKMNYKKINT